MSVTKKDLDLINEAHELEQAFIDAKASRGKKDHDESKVVAASKALDAHRTKWRGIREYVQAVREAEWAAAQEGGAE